MNENYKTIIWKWFIECFLGTENKRDQNNCWEIQKLKENSKRQKVNWVSVTAEYQMCEIRSIDWSLQMNALHPINIADKFSSSVAISISLATWPPSLIGTAHGFNGWERAVTMWPASRFWLEHKYYLTNSVKLRTIYHILQQNWESLFHFVRW